MNGVHDLGGMDGFGRVNPEKDEPVFHEPWESRVFGMFLTGAGLPPRPVDAFRHSVERLDPVRYLSSSYYERWLAAFENGLIDAGTLTHDEIDARIQQFANNPDVPVPRRDDPARTEQLSRMLRAGNPVARKVSQKPRFALGEKVVTRNLNPPGHTRLPRYARDKRGIVVLHHGAHVFPDTNAHGNGENPQHLYTVSFSAQELWGDGAEANQSVAIDLWESYLDKDRSPAGKNRVGKGGVTRAKKQRVTGRSQAARRSAKAPTKKKTASKSRKRAGGTAKRARSRTR